MICKHVEQCRDSFIAGFRQRDDTFVFFYGGCRQYFFLGKRQVGELDYLVNEITAAPFHHVCRNGIGKLVARGKHPPVIFVKGKVHIGFERIEQRLCDAVGRRFCRTVNHSDGFRHKVSGYMSLGNGYLHQCVDHTLAVAGFLCFVKLFGGFCYYRLRKIEVGGFCCCHKAYCCYAA